MPLASEREIAADNGMWLTYPSHLEIGIRLSTKRLSSDFKLWSYSKDILRSK